MEKCNTPVYFMIKFRTLLHLHQVEVIQQFIDKINIYQNMLSDSRLRMSFEVKKKIIFDEFSIYKPT